MRCTGCTSRYIGQAERTFSTGFAGHVEAIRNKGVNSVYANRTCMLNIWGNNKRLDIIKAGRKGKSSKQSREIRHSFVQ